jgi:hypothetical protein
MALNRLNQIRAEKGDPKIEESGRKQYPTRRLSVDSGKGIAS